MPKKAPKTETFTPEQVKEHCSAQDLFVIVHGRVYDITGFVEEHPGGTDVLLGLGGQDATEDFEEVDHSSDARELLSGLQIGILKGYEDGKDQSKSGTSSPATLSKTSQSPRNSPGNPYVSTVIILIGVGVAAWLYY